jgi:hypothetical protein
MNNYIKILFFLLLYTSCSKENDFIEDISLPPVIDVPAKFISKSEVYSDINETVGNIITQKYTDKFFSKDEIFSVLKQSVNGINYYSHTKASVQYDFFNDGKVDFFGFSFGNGEVVKGKYILIEDINDNPKEPIIFDSDLYAASTALLSDTNGDGSMEILFFSENNHGFQCGGNTTGYLENILRISINENRDIIQERIGTTPVGTHDGTTGDIDNDGDIDIIVWPTGISDCKNSNNITLPIKLINDGNGNFSEYPFFYDEDILISEGFTDWVFTSYYLFDIDGDGILDLIGGLYMNKVDPRFNNESFNNSRKHLTDSGLYVIYGEGGGEFSYENIKYIKNSVFSNETQKLYGITFTDYNGDGNYDILTSSYVIDTSTSINIDGDNYVINLFKNNRNNNFENVTESVIDGYYDLTETTFTNFYSPMIHDIDGDGDYDIVASNYHWATQVNLVKLLYWEKNGSTYIRREISN